MSILEPVFRPVKTLKRDLMQVKNRTPEQKQTGVVYEVPCKDCLEVYVCETKRTLKVRLSEHTQAVRRGDPRTASASTGMVLQSKEEPKVSGRGELCKPSRSGNPPQT